MIEYVLVGASRLPVRWAGVTDHNVLLVLKDRPDWMKGRLNLVGGKIEAGETPIQAALRELKEESGLDAWDHPTTGWGGPEVCGKLIGKDCIVHCVKCTVTFTDQCQIKPREGETEKVEWFQFWQIKDDPRLMPNLRVIIPLMFMDLKGWTITDKNSSLDSLSHEIMISFDAV